jgi:hypothetical protein
LWGARKSIAARPSDRGRVKMKMLLCL